MTYTDILALADFIRKHHTRFAGRDARSAMTFDTLMRARDFLKKDPAATGISFDAELFYWDETGYHTAPTIITVELDGDGLRCTEAAAGAQIA